MKYRIYKSINGRWILYIPARVGEFGIESLLSFATWIGTVKFMIHDLQQYRLQVGLD